jgi:hypothetical protein
LVHFLVFSQFSVGIQVMSRDVSNDAKHDVVRVQEQLLDMLRMAGTEAPPPRRETPAAAIAVVAPPVAAPVKAPGTAPASSAPPLPGEDCPKCGSDTPWGRSNWCPECGYYPKAGFGGTGIVEDDTDGPPPTLLSIIPAWVIPTVVASVAMLIGSIICRFVFNDALLRSLVAITQLLVFAGFTFAVHSRASMLAMKTGRGWMAFVNPGETWALVLGRMPATRMLIMLLGCGLSGMVSSFVIGPDVDLIAEEVAKEVKNRPKVTFSDIVGAMTKMSGKAFGDPKKNLAMKAFGGLIQATGQMSGGGGAGPDDLEGSIGDLAGMASIVTADSMSGGGGGSGGEGGLENAIGDLGGTASEFTEGASGGNSSGSASSSTQTPLEGSDPKSEGLDDGKNVLTRRDAKGPSTPSESPPSSDNSNPPVAKTKGTFDYWIYGYTTNPEGELRSLLLATTGGSGPLRFSQKLGIEGFSTEELAKISEQLKPYRVKNSAISSPYGGKWVKPVAKCRVDHEGLNAEERPINPKFQKVILP